MDSDRYYRSSGSAPVVGLVTALAIGLVGGGVLSLVYALINYYNPLIYFTFLATIGFGLGCGMVSVFGVTLGKVRNRMLAGFAGLAIGFLSLYFAWVWYMYFVNLPGFPSGELLFDTTELFAKIKVAARTGLWSIRNATPTGLFLYIVWVLEAGIVLCLSGLIAYSHDSPFCEPCNVWCDEQECPATFSMPADIDVLRSALESGDLMPLYQSAQPSPAGRTYLQAKVYPCPKCHETTWLKLEEVTVSTNDEGEEEKDESTLVNYLEISRADGDRLMKLVPGSDALPVQQESGDGEEDPPPEDA